ncbi:gamma carbonic anhydrase family protein [Salinibacterium sp. dk2585]|uniref:gamma carbonic anhydrase family protein n=1 Tax=unclassified Salinibacterium TaxID=2632331 RepID=UPI0011C24ACC|nr:MULTISPECIES: gamma carbonic anhydrase family protein [unclassified Salinibacterium]QEE62629.1 gamma carbonic anhydrase family protein [Salinibacterium sp. dk2585]TXK52319.1 gamma carbonic anhydrase family protein [Salinibacterium sp. dk5596]
MSPLIVPIDGVSPTVANTAWVAPNATLIGRVTLHEQSSVFYGTVLRADVDTITLGAGSNLQDNVTVHCDAGVPTSIGAGVSVGHAAMLHGCTVEDDCLIGMSATVLNGAVIGKGSLVAAGAVVLEGTVIPPGSLVAGVPAKVRRELSLDEQAGLRENGVRYVGYKELHREALGG